MIRNVFLKNLLINTVFTALSGVNRLVPKKDHQVLLYANEGFRDNTKYLFDYMMEQGYNRKYQILVAASDHKKYQDADGVKYISLKKGILKFMSSGHVYYSFGRIPIIPTKKQTTIQMWHGTSFKGFDTSTQKTNSKKKIFYSYVFASSEYFRPIVERKFSVNPENIAICGHPRTDWLYRNDGSYDLSQGGKVVIWLPTFRKSSELGYADVETDNLIPFFTKDALDELEAELEKRQITLIVKLHPLQDVDEKAAAQYKYLKLMTNKQFVQKNYDLYTMMRQTDALITDYSSVFYDYFLLDRPIGFTEDDMEEYGSNRGFAVDDPNAFRPGKKIRSRQDLYDFLSDVQNGADPFKEDRKKINDLSNEFQDGQNCRRALEISGITL